MAAVSDFSLMELIEKAEAKHGVDTHMVIEIVPKNEEKSKEASITEVEEKDILWWVEFEDEIKVFDTFDMVYHYLLNEAEKSKVAIQ